MPVYTYKAYSSDGKTVTGSRDATTPEARVPTVIVAIALATVLTGVVFVVVGRSRLAVSARSIPYLRATFSAVSPMPI